MTAAGASSRAAAARAVAAVLYEGRNLDAALAHVADASTDSGQVQALAYGSLRWHCRYSAWLDELLAKPLRRRDQVITALLSVGLFQLFEGREPAYAAVSTTVEATRLLERPRLAGLVNGVLRRAQREAEGLQARALQQPSARYAHPDWLIEQLRADWREDFERILAANQQQPPMWLRVNRLRVRRDEFQARLTEQGIATDAPTEFADALRLHQPLPVNDIPGFAQGDCSVQDVAAQLGAALLAPTAGMRVLDACSAPGGKTTHLLEVAGGDLDLTALDNDRRRLDRVAENLQRLGLTATLQLGDACRPKDWWDGQAFERILLDAPCSATGVIRRHPDIRFLRRPADLPELARRQREMLASLWPLLAPGGRLLYATCSVLRAENQAVIEDFLGGRADARAVPTKWSGATAHQAAHSPGLQLLPGDADGDGFYYAVVEKTTDQTA